MQQIQIAKKNTQGNPKEQESATTNSATTRTKGCQMVDELRNNGNGPRSCVVGTIVCTREGGVPVMAMGNGSRITQAQYGGTYERSKDAVGCEAAKLCAKLTLPPNCLEEFCKLPAPPMGTFPPKAHPAALFALHTNPRSVSSRENLCRCLHQITIPILPFGNRFAPVLPGC